MPGDADRVFTLADLIDYELQLTADSRMRPEDLMLRDKSLLLDTEILKQGKKPTLKFWLSKVRGHLGERFLQLRQVLSLAVIALAAIFGWVTVRGLLAYEGQHPVNIFPFLALFVFVPLGFLLLLFFKGVIARFLGRLPGGWVSYSGFWLLTRVMKKTQVDVPVLDLWHRLKSLYPRIFTLQAWILSQSFALAYYLTAVVSFIFFVAVNDYAFAWQTTLRMGPDALLEFIGWLAWPFAWLGSAFVPSAELIQATQYDRFSGIYLQPQGSMLAADWWPFLLVTMIFYGCLPRLVLLLMFQMRLRNQLRNIGFNDFASEELWLRLQNASLGWEAESGTKASAVPTVPTPLNVSKDQPLLIVRWRQAPFQNEELQSYFTSLGFSISRILDAEGRESEFPIILDALKAGSSLALICDPWELPGEAFNRLRLAIRENVAVKTPIFLIPLHRAADGASVIPAEQDRHLWESSLKAFRDPYVGMLQKGHNP